MQFIYKSDHETRRMPLPWQEQGLSYTASGYGRKIPSQWQIFYQGRWRRIYHIIFSNAGTSYVVVKGERVVVW